MPYPVKEVVPATASAVADGGAVETVVLTLAGVGTAGPGGRVTLHGLVNVTAGTGATALVVKVREGATPAGLEVGTATTDTAVAADSYTVAVDVSLGNVDVAGQDFVLTVTETAATAAGTVNYAFLGGFTS